MKIGPLGELTCHSKMKGWLQSSKIEVGYFPGYKLRFILEDFENDVDPAQFIAAIKNFLSMTVVDREKVSGYVFKNYTDFVNAVGVDALDFQISSADAVWKHVQPAKIHVERRRHGDKKVYVIITAGCDWEQEHGLQIIYREGSDLNRVSEQDGHLTHCDAYDLPEEEDRIC